MSKQNGGIIGPDNVTTGGLNGVASGVFKLGEVTKLIRESKWPEVSPFTNTVPNSARFNRGSSDYLNRTPSSASNRKTFTFSFWVKRAKLAIDATIYNVRPDGNGANRINFHSGDSFRISLEPISKYIYTTRLFRDVSAWYHIVVAFDTTQGTAANRVKLYVNGVQETSFSTATYPDQNTNLDINTTSVINLGRDLESNSDFIDMYLAEFVFIDGQQLTPTSFGETNSDSGIWIPKIITGLTFGTNGYYLKNANAGALGTDSSGQSNNFTVNNLTSVDQSSDSPSNNFSTLNPLIALGSNIAYSDGNLTITPGTSDYKTTASSIAVDSGKWYAEFKAVSGHNGSTDVSIGIVGADTFLASTGSKAMSAYTNSFSYGSGGLVKQYNGSTIRTDATYTNGDIIGIAVDMDNLKLYWSKNGTFQNSGVPTSGSTGTGAVSITAGQPYYICAATISSGGVKVFSANFGSPSYALSSAVADGNGLGQFEYTPPTGYVSLCTNNLNI